MRCQNRNVSAPNRRPTPPRPATTAHTFGSELPPVVVVDEPSRAANVVLVVEVVDDTVGPTSRSSVVVTVVEATPVVSGGAHCEAVVTGGRQAVVGAAVCGGSVTGGSVTDGTVSVVGGDVLGGLVVVATVDVGSGAGVTCARPPEDAAADGLDTDMPNAIPAAASVSQSAVRTIIARGRDSDRSARTPST